ncbi:xylosyltransferase oxt-like isoform X1 [Centruroides vittatus]|uniref:xylosyltransferase oxt-like isoform X1 n=1 Tax=Centruroides vittatus TaxID=120091 RepID=UPI00350FC04D
MATDVRWLRRYRPFFIIAIVILVLQGFLAYSFYSIYSSEADITWKKSKPNHQFQRKQISYLDPLVNRFLDDYLTDDEDTLSNAWDRLMKDSSSRNIPPKDAEKQKGVADPAIPAAKDLQYIKNKSLKVPGLVVNDKTSNSNNSTTNSNKSEEILKLNQDELDFKPWCEITNKETISAIHRATTQACKQELVNITCLIQQGNLYPKRLPRYCPIEGGKQGEYLGCYVDRVKKRLLSGYVFKLNNNTPALCIDKCLRFGFQFAGVQYSVECFCGNNVPSKEFKTHANKCNMACPKEPQMRCGGYLTMNIYRTGLPKPIKHEPKSINSIKAMAETDTVRIVFLLTINGRAVRQVRRLIRVLYHERHYFYIHVDSRCDYLFRALLPLEEKYSNIRLSRWRLSTIWGGASLLQMLLRCISNIIDLKNWKWDFVINLSESDFPVKSLSYLERFLTANKGMNFIKSHGQDTQRFIAKQGLDKTFYECDTHMWRLGDRELPWGIKLDGGSDWLALSYEFSVYITKGDDGLLQGLKVLYQYTLLPGESFFHTIIQNSIYCDTIIDNNLHVTNWKRKQGCKCQYKHIVDWCGCSPNDFKPEDWPRLQSTEDRPFFFARKFEPIINLQVINQVELWINSPYNRDIGNILEVPSMNSYWQNDYHYREKSPSPDDSRLSVYDSFSRLGTRQLQNALQTCKLTAKKVQEATIYMDNDVFKGILVLYEATIPNVEQPVILETHIQPIQYYTVHKAFGPTGRLKFLQVGSHFDLKEQVFRNFGSILGPFSEPGAVHKWGPGQAFSATFVWVDSTNTVAGSYEVKIETGVQVLYHKPIFRQPLRPGIWTLQLLYNWVIVAEAQFLVTPLSYYNGHKVGSEQAKFLHNGPGQRYVDHDFSSVEILLGYTNKSTVLRQASANSRRYGKDLEEWIDSLVAQFWTVQNTCFLAQPQHPTGGAVCLRLDLDPCHMTTWSSRSPDPKSDIRPSEQKNKSEKKVS